MSNEDTTKSPIEIEPMKGENHKILAKRNELTRANNVRLLIEKGRVVEFLAHAISALSDRESRI